MNEILKIALLCKEEEQAERELKAALDSVESALIRSAALLTNIKGQPISQYWSKCIEENEGRVIAAYSSITKLYIALDVPQPEAMQSGEASNE